MSERAAQVVPRAAPAGRRIRAQAGMELRLGARNGENLLVTLGIPVALLVFFTLVDVLPTGADAPVAFLLPRTLAIAVMGAAFVSLAIATGFEREYLVLKRLGATPMRRRDLVAAKGLAVGATVAVQAVVLVAVAAVLHRAGAGAGSAVAGGVVAGSAVAPVPAAAGWTALALALGAAAFAGLGLLLAGTLRATLTLALANAAFVVLVLVSGLLFPLAALPGPLAAAAALLPSTALGSALDATLHGAAPAPAALGVLLAWAVAAPLLAAWRFRWE